MKKTLIFILLCVGYAHAQDTVTIEHIRYSTTFDRNLRYPVLVRWTVASSDICKPHTPRRVERKNSYFKADPKLPGYSNLGNTYLNNPGHYERGHNMDAADNSCDLVQMKECHYFSNITPQTAELNEQTWGDLEDHTRHMVELYGRARVWCGSFGHKEMMGAVTVPDSCWKIIAYNSVVEAYIFPNSHTVNSQHYDYYQNTVQHIRASTHLTLRDVPAYLH